MSERRPGFVRAGMRRAGRSAGGGGGGTVSLIVGTPPISVANGAGPTATISHDLSAISPGATYAYPSSVVVDSRGHVQSVTAGTQPVGSLAVTAPITNTGTATAPNVGHADSALSPGATYAYPSSVQVDGKGHVQSVTAGTAPQPLNANLTAIAALTTTSYGLSLLTLATAVANAESLGSEIPTAGSNLTDANATITIAGGAQYVLPAATLTANRVLTLGVTGSPLTGEVIAVLRRGTEAFTYTIQDDAATTLFTMPASTKFAAYFRFSGTHFILSSAVRIQ